MTATLKNGTATADRWFTTTAPPDYQRMITDRRELSERIGGLLP